MFICKAQEDEQFGLLQIEMDSLVLLQSSENMQQKSAKKSAVGNHQLFIRDILLALQEYPGPTRSAEVSCKNPLLPNLLTLSKTPEWND